MIYKLLVISQRVIRPWLLGIVNDLLKMLEIEWGVQMESFYTQNVGKYLREIMLEPNMAQLKLLLGDEADVAIDYL